MQKKTVYRLASLFILVALVFGSSLVARASAATFNPVADAYVNASSPTINYGTNTSLRVEGSPVMRGYLRFTVSGLGGAAIQSAMLRIYANSASSTGFSVLALSNNTWGETTITNANAPAPSSTISSSKSFAAATWVQVDISSYIKAEGTYDLVLTTTGTQTNLAPREDTAGHTPQLVVTTGTGGTTSTPTKTPIGGTPTKTPTPIPTGSGSGSVLILAGDICKHNLGLIDYTGNCKKTGDLVRSLLAANKGAQVQTLGDNVNNDGGIYSYPAEYADLYGPNWGSFLNVTHALVGNHDTYPPGGDAAYFSYFGAAAGPNKTTGYYSYNIGSSWHIIVLNAECTEGGGCGVGSVQTNWLQADLAANTRQCVMAVWHQPRFTSGRHTNDTTYAPWWNLLYQYKADLVMNGHNHNYERFNPINPSEQADPNGIREFIVGTGGAPGDGYTYASHPLQPNEVVRNQVVQYGVLKMTLSASSYSWTWLPAAGYTFTDSGSAACH